MKKAGFAEVQILGELRQMEVGVPAAELYRGHGMSSAKLYKWRAKYDGMEVSLISDDGGVGRGKPAAEAHVR